MEQDGPGGLGSPEVLSGQTLRAMLNMGCYGVQVHAAREREEIR
jgi:hypothetical protein